MRLGRNKDTARLRQRQAKPDTKPGLSYRGRNSDESPNLGRHINRKDGTSSLIRSGHFWLQRFGLIILLLAVIVSAINILHLSSDAEILPVTNTNSSTLLFNKVAYQAAANNLLAKSIWDHNKITVDTGQISRQLLTDFPDLSTVSVTIPLIAHHPVIYIEPAQPALIIRSASSGSFVLNEQGKAVLENTPNPIVTGQAVLPVVTDLSGLKLVLGHQVLPAETVGFIQSIVSQLSAKKYTVTTMSLPPATSELDVSLTGKPYIIKFNLENNDPRQQAGTFLATIAELQAQNITPSKYVDVRVDGRSYYQ
jgi:hypothetical protein